LGSIGAWTGNCVYYTPAYKVLPGYKGITTVHLSIFLVSTTLLMDELILMKLYTVAVKDLRMCMKGDNPGSNYFKGDNKLCRTGGIHS